MLLLHANPNEGRALRSGRSVRLPVCADGSLWHPPMAIKTLGSQVIEWRERVRYLGLHWGPNTPFVSCTAELLGAGRRAMFALCNRLDECKIWSPAIRAQVFDVQVSSVLSYGAELWGPDRIVQAFRWDGRRVMAKSTWELALADEMVCVQRDFLRRCVGAKRCSLRLLFRECSQTPLQVFWLRLALGFWNRLVSSRGTVYHDAFCDDVRLAVSRDLQVDCWAAKMLLILRHLRYAWPDTEDVI